MKIIIKENAKRALSLVLSLVMAFSLMTPAFAEGDVEAFGSVAAFTEGIDIEGKEEILATNKEEITLSYSKADASIGRYQDGWWAGIKVIAPSELTEAQLKDAKYRKYTADGWSDPISFWSAKDSKEGDAEHYMGAWMLVTPELIANDADGKLTINYEFDWDGNGFDVSAQKIDYVLDITRIDLNMDTFLGDVEPITKGLTAEGEEEVLVTNNEDITLYFSKANPAIGRNYDGWWAGIKIVAPSDLTAEELKNVKYRKYTADGWSDPISFWSAKDSKDDATVHYMEAWKLVTPELMKDAVDNKIIINYEFDWYGNGFESAVQKIDFVLDTTKIVLDHENHYGTVEALTQGIEVSGDTDLTVTNADEITLDFSRKDATVGRYQDGWWAGIKVIAPSELTEAQLKDAKYRKYTADGWSDPISFWSAKDSKEGDAEHYMGAWMLVTPELIANDADGKLTINYEFDWDGNGFGISTQKIDYVLDITRIDLNMEGYLGGVEVYTKGLSVKGTKDITVTNDEEITLSYSKADASIGRYQNGWWAGIKIVAPEGLTEEEIKNATYRRHGSDGWTDPISFWNAKDSKEGDAVHFMQAWMLVTPELIARETDEQQGGDGKLTLKYEFTWGENFVQEITYTLDVTKINLNMDTFLGDVEPITKGLTAEGEEEVLVTNNEDITLYFSKANPAIGRNYDGWWAGIKIVAPSDLTAEELKNVKYRKYTADGWSDPISFWSAKDSKDDATVHYMEAWKLVTPELMKDAVDNKIVINYEFDWYGNGFESAVQKIDFVLDTTKIVLDHENHYGTIEGITEGLTVSGTTDMVIKNENEITIDFSLADMSVGRYMDAWWVGAKILAPESLSVSELKDARYRISNGESKAFWDYKDSQDGDEKHYITVWLPVIQDYIDNDADGILNWTYEFDWDGNGFGISTQKFNVSVDVNKIIRIHSAGCTEVIDEEAVAPDCTNEGKNKKSHCSVCGLVIGDGAVLDALGHTDGEEVIENDVKPDCTTPGSYDTVVYCTVCGGEVSRVTTPVKELGHTDGEEVIENDVKPDCTTPGSYDTVVYCTVCGGEVSRVTTTVKELGHTDGEAVIENDVKPDCENRGSYDTVVYCTECGAEISRVTTTVKALSHNYSKKVIDARHLYKAKTCTTYAEYFYGCTRCDDMTSKTFINKSEGLLAHKKVKRIDKKYLVSAADCENPAKYYMGCSGCDTVFKSETYTDGEPMYHFYSVEKVTVKAGINKEGATDFFCKDCGKAFGDSIPFPGIKSIQLSGTSFSYNGKAITPSVTVKDSEGKTLKMGKDYTVSYSSNIAPGTASVKVTFTGSYTGSKTLAFTIKQLPATKKITFTSSTSAIKLTWEKVPNAAGYRVYRKTSKGWTAVGTTAKNTLTVKKLSAGTRYTFMVKACAKVGSKIYVSDASKSIYTATKASAPKKIISAQTTTSITLKWSKVSGAEAYRVYKYNTKTKKYELYKTVDGTKLTIKKLKSGTTYKYLVRAVTLTADRVRVVGEDKKITVSTNPAAPKIKVTSKGGTVTVKWSKVAGATGYRVYSMDSKTKKLKLIGTLKSDKTSFKKKGFKKGSKSTFAVRAYKTVNGENIFSAYTRKTVKIK